MIASPAASRPPVGGRPLGTAAALLGLLLVLGSGACGGCTDRSGSGVEPAVESATPESPPEVLAERLDPEIAAQLESLRGAVLEAPSDAGHWAALGMAFEMAGRNGAAERCYRQAELLDPTEPRYPYYTALIRSVAGDLEGALTAMDRVLALDDGYVSAWLYRGQWLLDLGRVEEARDGYQHATVLDRGSHVAWVGLARSLLRLGEARQAIAIAEPLLQRYRHPQVYQLLGLAYREVGDFDRARMALARARPGPRVSWSDPWNQAKLAYEVGFGAGMRRAEFLLDRGRPAKAIELLEELREDRPDDVALLNNLSVAYGQTGRPELALQVLRESIERHPDYYPFHLNIANRYHERGEIERALEHLDRAIEPQSDTGLGLATEGELPERDRTPGPGAAGARPGAGAGRHERRVVSRRGAARRRGRRLGPRR